MGLIYVAPTRFTIKWRQMVAKTEEDRTGHQAKPRSARFMHQPAGGENINDNSRKVVGHGQSRVSFLEERGGDAKEINTLEMGEN